MLIHKSTKSQAKESEITPESVYQNRRKFLKLGAGVTTAGLFTPAVAKLGMDLSDLPNSAFDTDETLTSYKKVTTYNNFYELSSDKYAPAKLAKHLISDPWAIEVAGHCDNPGTYDLEKFVQPHRLEDRIYRLRCVEAWSMVIPWVGFELNKVIAQAKPTSKSKICCFSVNFRPRKPTGTRTSCARLAV